MPGRTDGNTNSPAPAVWVRSSARVPRLIRVMEAPAIAEADGSMMSPPRRAFWAWRVAAHDRSAITEAVLNMRAFMLPSLRYGGVNRLFQKVDEYGGGGIREG